MQLGTGSFGATANYTHRFSTKSHGRIGARIGRFIDVYNSSYLFLNSIQLIAVTVLKLKVLSLDILYLFA